MILCETGPAAFTRVVLISLGKQSRFFSACDDFRCSAGANAGTADAGCLVLAPSWSYPGQWHPIRHQLVAAWRLRHPRERQIFQLRLSWFFNCATNFFLAFTKSLLQATKQLVLLSFREREIIIRQVRIPLL